LDQGDVFLPQRRDDQLVIAVTARALFDLGEATGRTAEPRGTGPAMPLIKALLRLNRPGMEGLVEIVLVSRTEAAAGPGLMSAARRHGIEVTRAAFTGGRDPYPHLAVLSCDLFLTTEEAEVQGARQAGFVAGLVAPGWTDDGADEVRIVFDGDAAPFAEDRPAQGPELAPDRLVQLLRSIGAIQQVFPAGEAPLRTAVFTARPSPADQQVIAALDRWNVRADESMLLRGDETDLVLEVLRPHLYFTDHLVPTTSAAAVAPLAPVASER
jgi:5'-nucleotidase